MNPQRVQYKTDKSLYCLVQAYRHDNGDTFEQANCNNLRQPRNQLKRQCSGQNRQTSYTMVKMCGKQLAMNGMQRKRVSNNSRYIVDLYIF